MKKILILLSLFLTASLFAQTGTEIYLFDINFKDGQIALSNPQNITKREGYDNQPSFHKTKPIIYFSSFNEEGRSDIKTYNYKTGKTKNFTTTHEREYSPTLTPDGKFVSCILQRDNGAQDLVKYPIKGGNPIVLIKNILVGYHAWIDNTKLITFILNENGGELRYFDLDKGESKTIIEKVGRSLHKIPHTVVMSFIDKTSDEQWTINRFNPITEQTYPIANTLPSREDMCWTNNGLILMSDGDDLYFMDAASGKTWEQINMNGISVVLEGITRLAINPENNKLAVVVSE